MVGEHSQVLVETLHRIMLETDSSQLDMEQWSHFTAATNCLSLLAECLGHLVTDRSLAFINQMINSDQWRNKHTAIISLSTLLEMEDRSSLSSVVSSFLSTAETFLQNENSNIRNAASFLLFQVSDKAVDALNTVQSRSSMSGLACICLQSPETRMTEHGCLVISNIIRSLEKETNKEIPYFVNILQHLLSLTDANTLTGSNSSVRQLAFTALSDIIDQCQHQHLDLLRATVPVLLRRLELLLLIETNSQLNTEISFNSSILNSILPRLHRAEILQGSPEVLAVICKMFDHQELHEDSLQILRSLVDQLGQCIRLLYPIQSQSQSQTCHGCNSNYFLFQVVI